MLPKTLTKINDKQIRATAQALHPADFASFAAGIEFAEIHHGALTAEGAHTPSPWGVYFSDEELYEDGTIALSPNGFEIRPSGNQKLGNEQADLKLMAQSPDLLHALKRIVNLFDNNQSSDSMELAIKCAREVIKAAT